MKPQNKMALIVAYYLSKYDTQGIRNLGYSSFQQAYSDIGKKVGVKATWIKNVRDEFDPIHENQRVGWYQRPMVPSRVAIVHKFENLSEPSLRSIVLDVLNGDISLSETINRCLADQDEVFLKNKKHKKAFILRGPTGRKAEDIFINKFKEGRTPFCGNLNDFREYGQGYDFLITGDNGKYFLEVKGLDGETGGVSFTDKEWAVAKRERKNYFLVIVSQVGGDPEVAYFQDPISAFSPERQISTSIIVRWIVSPHQVLSANKNSRFIVDAGVNI